jgi:hypothetical protein
VFRAPCWMEQRTDRMSRGVTAVPNMEQRTLDVYRYTMEVGRRGIDRWGPGLWQGGSPKTGWRILSRRPSVHLAKSNR